MLPFLFYYFYEKTSHTLTPIYYIPKSPLIKNKLNNCGISIDFFYF